MKPEIKLGRGGTLGNLKGQAGVFAVASQLCMVGHIPSFPAVDCGVDLTIENGLRLQVKTAHITYSKARFYPHGSYIFNLRRGVWDHTTNRASRREYGTYAGVADFFVLWGIDEDRFWIVPANIKNRNISFSRLGHVSKANSRAYLKQIQDERLAAMEDRWDLLDVNAVVNQVTIAVPKPGIYPISISEQEKP